MSDNICVYIYIYIYECLYLCIHTFILVRVYMSFQKFKTNSYCVGHKHYSGTENVTGEITFNKKTGKEIKLLVGKYVICDGKKSIIVSDNTIKAEGLGSFFQEFGKDFCES